MSATLQTGSLSVLLLDGKTAAELMTPTVVSVPATAPVAEAAAVLTERKLSAVAVTGPDGRAVGVVSRTDIVAHDCRRAGRVRATRPADDQEDCPVLVVESEPDAPGRTTQVRDIMTPAVYSVPPEAEASAVVSAMLTLGIHRIFVSGPDGGLLGVISSTDLLRHLHEPLVVAFDRVEVLCPNAEAARRAAEAVAGDESGGL